MLEYRFIVGELWFKIIGEWWNDAAQMNLFQKPFLAWVFCGSI
jgi:hypothetical protein